MTRLLPFPLVSAGLLGLWLLLNQALSWAMSSSAARWRSSAAGRWRRCGRRRPAFGGRRHLSALVAGPGRHRSVQHRRGPIVLGSWHGRSGHPGFVNIPLELRDPYGLAALACIITSTPGTLWVEFDAGEGTLMIHVLDLVDENDWSGRSRAVTNGCLLEIFA